MGDLESLEAVGGLGLLSNDVEDRVDELSTCNKQENTRAQRKEGVSALSSSHCPRACPRHPPTLSRQRTAQTYPRCSDPSPSCFRHRSVRGPCCRVGRGFQEATLGWSPWFRARGRRGRLGERTSGLQEQQTGTTTSETTQRRVMNGLKRGRTSGFVEVDGDSLELEVRVSSVARNTPHPNENTARSALHRTLARERLKELTLHLLRYRAPRRRSPRT